MNFFDFGFEIRVSAQRPPLSAATASISIDGSNNLLVSAVTALDLSLYAWGFEYSEPNSAVLVFSEEQQGSVTNQLISVPLAELGNFSSGDTIDVKAYYNPFPPGVGSTATRIYIGAQTELTVP